MSAMDRKALATLATIQHPLKKTLMGTWHKMGAKCGTQRPRTLGSRGTQALELPRLRSFRGLKIWKNFKNNHVLFEKNLTTLVLTLQARYPPHETGTYMNEIKEKIWRLDRVHGALHRLM
jgi:hypothetical protein